LTLKAFDPPGAGLSGKVTTRDAASGWALTLS
jgi:hypothetical protein